MKHQAALFALALTLSPAVAQEAAPEDGPSLMQRGAELMFRDMMERFAPEVDNITRDLGEAMGTLAPAMRDVARLMDDISNYERPERLPNGDVLIRRKAAAPPPPPLEDGLLGFGWPGDEPESKPPVPVNPDLPQTEL